MNKVSVRAGSELLRFIPLNLGAEVPAPRSAEGQDGVSPPAFESNTPHVNYTDSDDGDSSHCSQFFSPFLSIVFAW